MNDPVWLRPHFAPVDAQTEIVPSPSVRNRDFDDQIMGLVLNPRSDYLRKIGLLPQAGTSETLGNPTKFQTPYEISWDRLKARSEEAEGRSDARLPSGANAALSSQHCITVAGNPTR